MRVRDEELVQFLLGDADVALSQRVAAALAADPQVCKRLEELRAALGLLDALKLTGQPPDDLVARTMSCIEADSDRDAAASLSDQFHSRSSEPSVQLRRASNTIGPRTASSSRQFWDSAILSVSIIVICCLMLPLMLESRSQSRRLQCAHNLAAIGRGLTQLAMMNSERRLPTIPASGREAFAGKYVLDLRDAQLLESPAVVKCPSMAGLDADTVCVMSIPSREEFWGASDELQDYWRTRIGGNYAYNLGVLEEGRITAARLEGRTHFAIAGDAVAFNGTVPYKGTVPFSGTVPFNGNEQTSMAHEGRGVNIFYEDGHVAFIPRMPKPVTRVRRNSADGTAQVDDILSVRSWLEADDNPFCNMDGDCARGSHPSDSVIGPSAASPQPKRLFLR